MNDIEQTGLQVSRNTQQNVDYYKGLTEFFEQDPTATLAKLFSFPVYVPRQVIEDFLSRYELYRMIQNLHGSIFEFGTFNGGGCFSFATFSAIMEPQNLTRKIVTFDTFSGFPDISEADKRGNPELVHRGGLTGRPLERLEKARALWDRNRFLGHVAKLDFVKGDILETLVPYLEENPHSLPALLYLDFDLFEPTAHVLRHMMPRMQKGSIVAFDELNHPSFPGETVALLQELAISDISVRRIPFSSRISYVIVGGG
jgi:hypothetical protein